MSDFWLVWVVVVGIDGLRVVMYVVLWVVDEVVN